MAEETTPLTTTTTTTTTPSSRVVISQQQHQQPQQHRPSLRRTSSMSSSSRRPRTPPSLPVIHEDEGSSGSDRRVFVGVVWPPEDDSTWPPREEEEDPTTTTTTTTTTMTEYGTVVLPVFRDEREEVIDSISSASSSSSSPQSPSYPSFAGGEGDKEKDDGMPYLFYYHASPTSSGDDEDENRYERRRRAPRAMRRLRGRRTTRGWGTSSSLLSAAIFALSLSVVAWLPLLRPSHDDNDNNDVDDYEVTVGHKDRPRSSGGWTRNEYDKYDNYDDYDDDDDYGHDEGRDNGRPPSWWAMPRLSDHRDGSSSSSAAARGEGEDVVASSAVVGDHDRDRRAGNDYVDDGGPVHVRENSTFSELAAAMVPAYFQWTVDLCAYTIAPASSSSSSGDNATDDVDVDIDDSDGGDRTSAMPGEVYALRKTMLRTRDLLDVFSPVYSRRSSLDDYDGWASTTRIIRWGGGRGQRVELDVESDGRTGGNSRRRKNSSTTSRSSSSSSRRRRRRREDGGKKRGGHANDDGGGGAAERSRPPPSSVHVAGGGVGSSLGSSLGRFLGWGLEAIGDWKVGKREEKEQTTTTTRGGKDGEAIIHDLWGTLRGFLDDGYMLLGDFQDLDHANVTYPPERLLSYQRRIWEWRAGFMTFVETNGPIVSFYLSLPCIGDRMRPSSSRRDGRCSHVHRRPSHLFWGNASADDLPDGNADAASIALGRLGYLQLGRAEAYLRDALAYEYVLNSTGIPPEIDATTNETGGEDVDDDLKEGGDEDDGGGLVDVHAIYHNVRKELRSFLDELDMFGGLLLPGTSVIPEIARDGPSIVSANVHIDEERRELIDRAIHALSKMKAMLGDLNDDYVAYSMYKEWDVYPEEVLVLGTSVENRWKDFRAWANEVGLFAKIEFLRGCLFPDESLSTEIEDEGKEVEEKTVTSDLLSHNLESFLIERKTNPTDHVVLGNDAGDADSIISAITLAYIESRHSTGLGNATPIVSIPKDEFTHERPETNLLFQLAGLKDNVTEILLFIEDLRDILDEDMRGGGLLSRSVSLVDHNTLNDPLLTFQENIIVTEILDHHEDEHKYEETCSGDHRIIAFDNGHVLVASTTTLVAERLRLEKYPIPYPASIGTLLLGVILLDSINLDESLGKVTERDREAVADLLTNTDWSAAVQSSHIRINDSGGITVDTNDLFNKLQLSKYNPKYWDELPVPRALASDYKHFGDDGERKESEFGIASILMKGEDFMNKDGFDKATLEFMHTAHISFLGIIFVFYDEGSVLHKQLAFISSDGNLEELINSLLISDAYKSVNLQLEEVSILSEADRSLKIRLFDQENLAPSRKQIGPMLEDYFGSV